MGTVFVGHHRRIHRQVAIKVLKASIAADETMVRRFEREAQAAGRIGSKHIVEVVDVGQIAGGERYMVLEHLRGETLLARLRRVRTMDPPESFPLAIQLLKGLAAAHAAGIIHRDLKPSNIFLVPLQDDGGDFVKIIDFGVSKFHCLDAEGMTQTGTMVGTPHYMAPEQTKEAAAVDHRSDLYAVGALLYRALAGRTPFRVTTIHELIAKLISEDPPALSTVVAGIDPAAAAIVHRALARTPEDRFADAEQFMDALRGWLTDGGVSFTSGRFSNVGLSWPGTSAPLPAGGPAPSAPAGEMSSAGEPATLATPSPAFYDTTAQYGPKRSTVGLALAGGAVVLVGSVMAIVSLVGGDETTAPGETTASAATGPGGETTVSKRIDQEPQAT
ncbi:MAG: serine/threonine protein kinase, partial [Deltaproteobacteria bacterium]